MTTTTTTTTNSLREQQSSVAFLFQEVASAGREVCVFWDFAGRYAEVARRNTARLVKISTRTKTLKYLIPYICLAPLVLVWYFSCHASCFLFAQFGLRGFLVKKRMQRGDRRGGEHGVYLQPLDELRCVHAGWPRAGRRGHTQTPFHTGRGRIVLAPLTATSWVFTLQGARGMGSVDRQTDQEYSYDFADTSPFLLYLGKSDQFQIFPAA